MTITSVTENSSGTNQAPVNLRIDYRAFVKAAGYAVASVRVNGVIERELWSAYERMHVAADRGAMDWSCLDASMNCIKPISKFVDVDAVHAVISGLSRNIDTHEPFRVWSEADRMMRGLRLWHSTDLHRRITQAQLALDRAGATVTPFQREYLEALKAEHRAELAALRQAVA